MQNQTKSQTIDSIYIIKFLAACLIIHIHIPSINILLPISRIAVPCFFMISGFFLYDEEHFINTIKVRKVIKKILRLTIKIHILYFIIIGLFNYYYDGDCRIKWNSLSFIAKVILYGENIPFYTYNNRVFWYLTAYIETLLVLLLFKINGWGKKLVYLIPIGLIVNLVLGRYSFFWGGPYHYILRCNFFTMGIPFVLIGTKLKGSSVLTKAIQNISNKKIIILTLIALAISGLEYLFQSKILYIRHCGELNIFTIPTAIGAMIITLKNQKVSHGARILVWLGKNCSTNIYLYHILIYFFINFLYLSGYCAIKNMNSYLAILLLTIIFSIILHFIKTPFLTKNISLSLLKRQ